RLQYTYGLTQRLQAVEGVEWRLTETEVLDRARDLAPLDQPETIGRGAGAKQAVGVDHPDIGQPRDQEPTLGLRDHLLDRGVTTTHTEGAAVVERVRLVEYTDRIAPRIGELLEHPILDPGDGPHRRAITRKGDEGRLGIRGIGADRDTRIEDELADLRPATTPATTRGTEDTLELLHQWIIAPARLLRPIGPGADPLLGRDPVERVDERHHEI